MPIQLRRTGIGIIAIAGVAFVVGRGSVLVGGESAASAHPAQDTPQMGQDPSEFQMDEEMQAMMAAMQPGEHHKALEPLIGTFNAEVKFWMEPNSEPMVFNGTISREWVLGDRFVVERIAGDSDYGQFEGLGYIGYNNFDQQYESIWMESASTAIAQANGVFKTEEHKLVFMGNHRDPTGAMKFGYFEIDMSDPDLHVATGYSFDENGKDFKNFEGIFERVN